MTVRSSELGLTAVTLCRDNDLLIRVFALPTRGNIRRVVLGEDVGTVVCEHA